MPTRIPNRAKLRPPYRARATAGIVAAMAACSIVLLLSACGAVTTTTKPTRQPGDQPIPGSQSGTRLPPIIYRPSWLSQSTKAPLVIALYGYDPKNGGSPQEMEGLSHFEALASQKGFVVAYLASSSKTNPWNPRTDDLAYVSSMIDQLTKSQNIDPSRVYITGFSAGGNVTFSAGCGLSNKVAAIAVVAFVLGPKLYADCALTRPVPELLMVGNQDGVRFSGIPGRVPSAAETTAKWRALDGCAARPVQTQKVSSVLQQTWTACTDGSAVGLYTIEGGGHDWPPYGTGAPKDYSASAAIWAFFAAHRAAPTSLSGDAGLGSVRVASSGGKRTVMSSFRFGELVGVQETLLSSRGFAASHTGHSAKGTFKLRWVIPSKLKAGRYSLSVALTDTYGRRLTLSRTIQLPKLPSHLAKHATHRIRRPAH